MDLRKSRMMGETVLVEMAKSIMEFVGGVPWTESQMLNFAAIAYQEYYWFTFAEIKQFSLRVKTGVYESNKNVSPVVLMGWMLEYSQERLEHRYNHYSQLKPDKPKVLILNIKNVTNPKGKKLAELYCEFLGVENQKKWDTAKENIGKIAEKMQSKNEPEKPLPESRFKESLEQVIDKLKNIK